MTQLPAAASIPLRSLYIHDLNARSEPTPEEIRLLADSIEREGLLQNLCGFRDGGDNIGIVAGGRRLRALQLLHGAEADHQIPVYVTEDNEQARSWAGTENTARAALHPADEIRAYGRARLAGRSDADIAKSFAKTEKHVKQRLKLASLPVPALDALRADKITLDVAAALTVEPNKDRLLGILDTAIQRGMSATEVRNAIANGKVAATDRRAVFVGLDVYVAMGGITLSSLFTDEVILEDVELLDQLFADSLEVEAKIWLARGASWVKTTTEYYVNSDLDREIPKGFRPCYPPSVDLPEAEQTELEALEAEFHYNLTQEQQDRKAELRERKIGQFDDDALPDMGIVLLVNRDAKLKVVHYAKADFIDSASGENTAETVTPKAETVPQNLIDDLAAIRLASLQKCLMDQPELLLDILAYQIDLEHSWCRPLGITFSNPSIQPGKTEGTTLPARLADKAEKNYSDATPEGLATFQGLGKKHRNTVLATAFARTFRHEKFGNAMAARLTPKVREIWTPTAAGYLGRITVAMLDAIFDELVPADANVDRADFLARKKAEKAKFLEGLFSDMSVREALGLSREQNARIDAWLPDQLQWPAAGDAA